MTLLYSEMNSTETRKTQNENIFNDHLFNRAILFHSPDTMLLLSLKRNTPPFLKKNAYYLLHHACQNHELNIPHRLFSTAIYLLYVN